jgi:hypothetical protein
VCPSPRAKRGMSRRLRARRCWCCQDESHQGLREGVERVEDESEWARRAGEMGVQTASARRFTGVSGSKIGKDR